MGAPTVRIEQTAIWTGTKMIVWGGYDTAGNTYVNTGGRYNPATNNWTSALTTGAPAGKSNHTAIWTGARMIVWGGKDGSAYFGTGGRYTPSMISVLFSG